MRGGGARPSRPGAARGLPAVLLAALLAALAPRTGSNPASLLGAVVDNPSYPRSNFAITTTTNFYNGRGRLNAFYGLDRQELGDDRAAGGACISAHIVPLHIRRILLPGLTRRPGCVHIEYPYAPTASFSPARIGVPCPAQLKLSQLSGCVFVGLTRRPLPSATSAITAVRHRFRPRAQSCCLC
jgi:hypothetical protein